MNAPSPGPGAADGSPASSGLVAWFERHLGFLTIGRLIAVLIVVTPLLAIYSRRQLVVLLPLGAVVILFAGRFGGHPVRLDWVRIDWRIIMAGLLLLAWGAISLAWTIDPPRTAGVAASALGIAVAGWLLVIFARLTHPAEKPLAGKAVIAAAFVGIVVVAFEAAIDMAGIKWLWPLLGQDPPKWLVYLNFPMLVLTPVVPVAAAYALHRGWWWIAVLLYAGALGLASQMHSGTAILALAGGGAALFLFAVVPQRVRLPLGIAIIAAGLVFVPLLGKPMASSPVVQRVFAAAGNSAVHRLGMWSQLGDLVWQRPWLGAGMGASRTLPEGRRIIRPSVERLRNARLPIMPMHPHNTGLELGIELGLIGLLLGFGFLAALAAGGLRAAGDRWSQAGVGALATSATISGMMGLSVWNFSFVSAYVIAMAALLAWMPKSWPGDDAGVRR